MFRAVLFLVVLQAISSFSFVGDRMFYLRRGLASRHLLAARVITRKRSFARMSSNEGRYDHKSVEAKWQAYWEEKQTFKTPERDLNKPKKYVLDMFPYPSGSGLHVGHPEGYTASDVMARYWRMTGHDVLHPMGWDSFGLPAEQHAIQTGTHPKDTTYKNIATFKRQLKSLGFSYDWNRELATTDVDFVRWTQWIFLQLFKAGLAEQSEALVNWCPALGTVLANEEIINGLSERGDHPVVRQPLRQWVLKITQYANQLEDGLAGLQWPEGTLTAQRQWIGRSEGASISFPLSSGAAPIEVFTTRPDTLMGVTYIVLAPEHAAVESLASPTQRDAVSAYVTAAASKSDLDRTAAAGSKTKTGVPLGADAIHPLTGEKVPIWIADYVLGGYGTGAVMAVPGHDVRDFAFAQAFDLPIKRVVAASKEEGDAPLDEAFVAYGVSVGSGAEFDGLSTEDAKVAVVKALETVGRGAAVTNFKLRDWIFSRQRYWGEPIPIYFPVDIGEEGGDPREGAAHTIRYDQPLPVPDEELPLTLPPMESFEPGDDPAGCLARAISWRYFQKDGKWFARETNTMPQWAGSCWYYLRFTDPKNSAAAWSKEADRDWLPVDLYVGGQEHAVLHLLYARFWHRVLHDLGYAKDPEPFQRLVHQGMILGADGEKMSKSRGNVVNPDDIVNMYGADALRMYEMFMGPLEAVKPWQTSQVAGVVRFRDRVYALCRREDLGGGYGDEETQAIHHKTMRKVTGDIESLSFNTAISSLMILSTHLTSLPNPPKELVKSLVLMLSPFAPHVAEECWAILGAKETLAYHAWVKWDEALCVEKTVKIGVQVNGKLRGDVELTPDATEEEAKAAAAIVNEKVASLLAGAELKKFVYVPGRIINFVVAGAKKEKKVEVKQ